MEEYKEVWRPITGFEDRYDVSNIGRVRSLPRLIETSNGKKYFIDGRILKLCNDAEGYKILTLKANNEDKRKTRKVHRFVAEAFLPNPKNKPQVNHKDGDKLNNHVDNLEWCTRSENMKHAYRTGLKKSPESGRKLMNFEILMIRDYLDDNILSQLEIAEMFDVDPSSISNINRGKTWNNIKIKE